MVGRAAGEVPTVAGVMLVLVALLMLAIAMAVVPTLSS